MADGDWTPLTVGYVEGGDVPPVDHERIRVCAVGAAAASDGWLSVDCAVLVGADGVGTLTETGDLPVPTLLYDPDDDPAVAARVVQQRRHGQVTGLGQRPDAVGPHQHEIGRASCRERV